MRERHRWIVVCMRVREQRLFHKFKYIKELFFTRVKIAKYENEFIHVWIKMFQQIEILPIFRMPWS